MKKSRRKNKGDELVVLRQMMTNDDKNSSSQSRTYVIQFVSIISVKICYKNPATFLSSFCHHF